MRSSAGPRASRAARTELALPVRRSRASGIDGITAIRDHPYAHQVFTLRKPLTDMDHRATHPGLARWQEAHRQGESRPGQARRRRELHRDPGQRRRTTVVHRCPDLDIRPRNRWIDDAQFDVHLWTRSWSLRWLPVQASIPEYLHQPSIFHDGHPASRGLECRQHVFP